MTKADYSVKLLTINVLSLNMLNGIATSVSTHPSPLLITRHPPMITVH